MTSTVDHEELAKFEAGAARWWDVDGPMAPLHKLNPVRLAYIRDHLLTLQPTAPPPLRPLKDLTILDVGCGAGLASEPMAKMGGIVTGIDPAPGNVEAARAHAAHDGLSIDYRETSLEEVAASGQKFDACTMLEVLEHVPDQQAMINLASSCLRPGGLLIVSTISKTIKAYFAAIIGVEYLLGWLEPGTHQWRKFIKPSSMAKMMRQSGIDVTSITGVAFDPSRNQFTLSRDPAVNYMMTGRCTERSPAIRL